MGILLKVFLTLSCCSVVFAGCSSGGSKPKKGNRAGSQYNQNQNGSVPPYSYQQTQQPQPYQYQPSAGTQPNNGLNGTSNYPGLFGGQGLNQNGGSFSLSSILGLLGQFLGLGNGNGTGLPFSFLSSTTPRATTVAVGIATYRGNNCTSGIITIPAGQSAAYYNALCAAYSGNSTGSLALNGQCYSLAQPVDFEDICQAAAAAETVY